MHKKENYNNCLSVNDILELISIYKYSNLAIDIGTSFSHMSKVSDLAIISRAPWVFKQ